MYIKLTEHIYIIKSKHNLTVKRLQSFPYLDYCVLIRYLCLKIDGYENAKNSLCLNYFLLCEY